MHFTYNEKIKSQQGRSETEYTKDVAGHSYFGGIPAEPFVGSGTSTTGDFVFEDTDEGWPEKRKS